MTPYRMHLEHLAQAVLDGQGIGAIWQLHLDAAYAHRTGYPTAANAILDLVEAIEQEVMRRDIAAASLGNWR
jgi:hypothetical protein